MSQLEPIRSDIRIDGSYRAKLLLMKSCSEKAFSRMVGKIVGRAKKIATRPI